MHIVFWNKDIKSIKNHKMNHLLLPHIPSNKITNKHHDHYIVLNQIKSSTQSKTLNSMTIICIKSVENENNLT